MIVKEKNLSKIIKEYFNLKTILFELEGIMEGHISIVKAVCMYKHRNGMLYLFDIMNNIRINIGSQYEISFDKNKNKLKIKLDNGQSVVLTVIK